MADEWKSPTGPGNRPEEPDVDRIRGVADDADDFEESDDDEDLDEEEDDEESTTF